MDCKIKDLTGAGSPLKKYCSVTWGDIPLWKIILNEAIILFFGYIPGALGLALRKVFFPFLFGKCGSKVVFGWGLSMRHPCKIILGDGVIIDDGVMLDAKGETNKGITLGDGVFIGRNTKIYCKNGDIALGEKVNVSSNSTLYSNNSLTIGKGTMIGAYSYILSGGEYDWRDPAPYCKQNGMGTQGPLTIGEDCWLGARVTILDSTKTIGERAVIAASALVCKPVSPRTLVGGVPAKPIKDLSSRA